MGPTMPRWPANSSVSLCMSRLYLHSPPCLPLFSHLEVHRRPRSMAIGPTNNPTAIPRSSFYDYNQLPEDTRDIDTQRDRSRYTTGSFKIHIYIRTESLRFSGAI